MNQIIGGWDKMGTEILVWILAGHCKGGTRWESFSCGSLNELSTSAHERHCLNEIQGQ